jgi:hypothetical protein
VVSVMTLSLAGDSFEWEEPPRLRRVEEQSERL